jgi:hypothetical protein
MKALRVAIRTVVAGVFLVGVVAAISFASFRAGYNARCKTGSWLGPRTPERAKLFEGMEWTRHALACRVGEYQVMVPSESGQGDGIYIVNKERMFFAVNDKETDVIDDSGKHLLFSLTRATADRVSTISYSAYNQPKGAWIQSFDLGADGTLDYRTTEINDRTVKQEYLVGEQWLEFLQRDGRPGVVFNGQFMPVSDAIKIANATERK